MTKRLALETSAFRFYSFEHTYNGIQRLGVAWHLLPSQAFPRLSGEHARAGEKREAREEDDGNERRAQAGSDGKENFLCPRFP